MVLALPVAALLAGAGVANTTPDPGPEQCSQLPLCLGGTLDPVACSVFGLANLTVNLTQVGTFDPLALANPFLDIAWVIPILNVFVGNGIDGSALHPNGFNGGLLIGRGGDGFSQTTAGANGGDRGSGGNGATGVRGGSGTAGGHGGAGGTGGSSGAGGASGSGASGGSSSAGGSGSGSSGTSGGGGGSAGGAGGE